MQTIIHYYDTVLCVAILLVSCDYLRAVYFFDQPMLSAACAVTASGSFGLVLYLLNGGIPPFWAVMLHTSIGIFVAEHYFQAVKQHSLTHWIKQRVS